MYFSLLAEQERGDSKHYRHDRENRLVQFEDEDSGVVVDYSYDTAGQRLLREENGNKLLYFYDGLNILMIKEKPAGCTAWRTKNAYTLKQADIGQIISEREYSYAVGCSAAPSSHLDRWYHFDMLGNTLCTTLGSGAVEEQVEMEAFGGMIGGEAMYALTGKPIDKANQLNYFARRWQMSELGLFIELAPYDPMTEHSYSFVSQSPTEQVDPSGLIPNPVACGVCLAAAMIVCYQSPEDCDVATKLCDNVCNGTPTPVPQWVPPESQMPSPSRRCPKPPSAKKGKGIRGSRGASGYGVVIGAAVVTYSLLEATNGMAESHMSCQRARAKSPGCLESCNQYDGRIYSNCVLMCEGIY